MGIKYYEIIKNFSIMKKIVLFMGLVCCVCISSSAQDKQPDSPMSLYSDTSSFTETQIEVRSDNYVLPGILTMPLKGDSLPLIVLIHDAGALDRDESIGTVKFFKDLAHGLAVSGIAVLRYDSRAKVYPDIDSANITTNEGTVADANSAVALAKTFMRINKRQVYILGHGLGGMLAPRVAKLNPDISGLIIMAGNSRPLEDVIETEQEYILSLNGLTSDEEEQLANIKWQTHLVRSKGYDERTSRSELPLNIPVSYWKDLAEYNQTAAAGELPQPLLILDGKRDYKITADDFKKWKTDLGLKKKKNVKYILYPELNHLFIYGSGPSRPEEYNQPNNVSPDVIKNIVEWINSLQ